MAPRVSWRWKRGRHLCGEISQISVASGNWQVLVKIFRSAWLVGGAEVAGAVGGAEVAGAAGGVEVVGAVGGVEVAGAVGGVEVAGAAGGVEVYPRGLATRSAMWVGGRLAP